MSEVIVVGLPAALREFDPARFAEGLRTGMNTLGEEVATGARNLIEPHHWHGRFQQQIHVETTGDSLSNIVTNVGVNSALVPEARPISFGWKSTGGKQPPTEAIAAWLASKPELVNSAGSDAVTRNSSGFIRRRGTIAEVSQDSKVKSLAFLIARKIGREGYSFEPVQPFHRAWDAVAYRASSVIMAAIRKAA